MKELKNLYIDAELVLPTYNAHPYFSIKNLGKGACIYMENAVISVK